jgi:hypothetical protein
MNLEFKIFEDLEFEGSWRVESIDEKTNAVFIAIFSGPASERLAHEYLAFKTGKHPAAKPEVAPALKVEPASSEMHITLKDGVEVLFNPDSFLWEVNPRNKAGLVATPKPAFKKTGTKKGTS